MGTEAEHFSNLVPMPIEALVEKVPLALAGLVRTWD
jgi:hypothetical protein